MICPFKVGDRVHEVRETVMLDTTFMGESVVTETTALEWDPNKPDATVTEITARGFRYRYDRPITFVRANWGTTQEGEVFENGFEWWRKVE